MALNQSKAKRIMTNFIGASASVAVVTAVASVTIAIEARFINVNVFENQAFYELEVIENIIVEGSGSLPSSELEPAEPATVQLRVENQWDNYVIALNYGLNQGTIEPLRSNQSYTLSIELEDTLGWRTLDTYTFSTRPRTNAIITSISETTTPLSTLTSFEANVLTQDGFTAAERWEASLVYGTYVDNQTLSVGEQTLMWENLTHQNAPIQLQIFATINGERKLITEVNQLTTPFIDATIDLHFTNPETLSIRPTFNNGNLNGQFKLEWIDDEQNIQSFDLTNAGLTIENVIAQELYQLRWIFITSDDRNFVVLERDIISLSKPYFVLSLQPFINGMKVELTIDRIPSLVNLYLSIGLFDEETAIPFTRVDENDAISFYELVLETPIPLGSSLALTLVQASPYDYPITFYSFNFQGGISL